MCWRGCVFSQGLVFKPTLKRMTSFGCGSSWAGVPDWKEGLLILGAVWHTWPAASCFCRGFSDSMDCILKLRTKIIPNFLKCLVKHFVNVMREVTKKTPVLKMMWLLLWGFSSRPLLHSIVLYVFPWQHQTLCHYSLTVNWRATVTSSALFFLLGIALATQGLLCFHMNLGLDLSFHKNFIGILVGITWNPQTTVSNMLFCLHLVF